MSKNCNHATCQGETCRREAKAKKPPKPLKRTPIKKKAYKIKPRSKKMEKEMKLYAPLAEAYIKANPHCEILSPVCRGKADAPHHKKGRGKYLLDQSTWMPACNHCNGYVEENDKWARGRGFKLSRLAKH